MFFNKFIRKLCNWLYAFVMLMPILAILFLCCYGVFNDNATLTNSNVDDSFYYAINQIMDSNLFNWALDSFLKSPVDIFLHLFGVPNNSIYCLLLTYWLCISLGFIGFEILMWFISFARSLINDLNIGDSL